VCVCACVYGFMAISACAQVHQYTYISLRVHAHLTFIRYIYIYECGTSIFMNACLCVYMKNTSGKQGLHTLDQTTP